MKASELIERLKEEDPDREVKLEISGVGRTVPVRIVVVRRTFDNYEIILSND